MARRKLVFSHLGRANQAMRSLLATVGLVLSVLLTSCQDAPTGDPLSPPVSQNTSNQDTASRDASNAPLQWKQSIERPQPDWDYDGERILGHIGHDICLWDAATGELLHQMQGHNEQIHKVQFSPDGNHALSSSWMPPGPMQPDLISQDTSTILWDLAAGRDRDIFPGQIAGEFSPDGEHFVAFSARPDITKNTNTYTDSETGEVIREEEVTESVIRFDRAAVWETFTGRQLVKVKLEDEVYTDPSWDTLHFSPDGQRFILLSKGAFLLYNNSGAIVFNTRDGRELGRISEESTKSEDGHRYTSTGALASWGSDKARWIDLESGENVQEMQHDLEFVWGTLWTHDGCKAVAIPSREIPIHILDMESATMLTGANGGPQPRSAIISPDNSRLAIQSGGANRVERELYLYDMKTGELITKILLPVKGDLIGFSPDSHTFLTGGTDYTVINAENESVQRYPLFTIYHSEDGEKIRDLNLQRIVDTD